MIRRIAWLLQNGGLWSSIRLQRIPQLLYPHTLEERMGESTVTATAIAAETSPERKRALLGQWLVGLRILHVGNFLAAKHCIKLNQRFGILVVIATSVVGSAIFASIGKLQDHRLQIFAGLLSLSATVLASLQTFLGYSNRASAHQAAAIKYGELRTEAEMLLTEDLAVVADLEKRLESIRRRWNDLDSTTPPLPDRIYEKARSSWIRS
jgi:hypothetical protein